MHRAAVVLFGLALAAPVALVAVAAVDERELAFTLPVGPEGPAARIWPGERACQRPVTAQADFEAVRLNVGSVARARLAVSVFSLGNEGAPRKAEPVSLTGGRQEVRANFGQTVRQEERFALCAANTGEGVIALYGAQARANDGSAVFEDGERNDADLALVFLREQPRSVLSQVPEMFERAALFRPGLVGPWTFWTLLVLVTTGIPALLVAALRRAVES